MQASVPHFTEAVGYPVEVVLLVESFEHAPTKPTRPKHAINHKNFDLYFILTSPCS